MIIKLILACMVVIFLSLGLQAYRDYKRTQKLYGNTSGDEMDRAILAEKVNIVIAQNKSTGEVDLKLQMDAAAVRIDEEHKKIARIAENPDPIMTLNAYAEIIAYYELAKWNEFDTLDEFLHVIGKASSQYAEIQTALGKGPKDPLLDMINSVENKDTSNSNAEETATNNDQSSETITRVITQAIETKDNCAMYRSETECGYAKLDGDCEWKDGKCDVKGTSSGLDSAVNQCTQIASKVPMSECTKSGCIWSAADPALGTCALVSSSTIKTNCQAISDVATCDQNLPYCKWTGDQVTGSCDINKDNVPTNSKTCASSASGGSIKSKNQCDAIGIGDSNYCTWTAASPMLGDCA